MPDNPRKKKQDRKRQSRQKHEVAYRNRARGGRSSRRVSGRSQGGRSRSKPARGSRNRGGRSQSRGNQNRGGQNRSRSMTNRGGRSRRSESMHTLRELLTEEMADILNAEKQLVRALPKMVQAANSDNLRSAFEQHLDETKEQVRRVEQAFEALGERPKNKKCDGMEGLITEGEHLLEEDFEGAVLDAGLIAAAQKVEHYEIATYGTICTWAELLGENAALRFLKQNMSEEEATDKRLTDIAEQINHEATTGGGGEWEEERHEGGRMRGLLSRVLPS